MEEVIKNLNDAKSITLRLGVSNKKEIKLFPVVVRYFYLIVQSKTKL